METEMWEEERGKEETLSLTDNEMSYQEIGSLIDIYSDE